MKHQVDQEVWDEEPRLERGYFYLSQIDDLHEDKLFVEDPVVLHILHNHKFADENAIINYCKEYGYKDYSISPKLGVHAYDLNDNHHFLGWIRPQKENN